MYSWLTLAGQVPTKATLLFPFSTGEEGENISLWVEISAGRDHSAGTLMNKTDLVWGN